jgi:hypothetical protein
MLLCSLLCAATPLLVALRRAVEEKTKAAETALHRRRLVGLCRVVVVVVWERNAAPSRTGSAMTSAPKSITAEPKVSLSTSSCALTNAMEMRP